MCSSRRASNNSNDGIREVFRDNFKEEEANLLLALSRYKFVSFDTEYPGVINQTPRDADDNQRYRDLKSNVERTKLIQVGITVFDPINMVQGGVWQFNFAGFSPEVHEHSKESINFLKSAGVDFAGNFGKGVRMTQFTRLLKRIRDVYAGGIQWVTFHGLYDAAYLLAALSGFWRLPRDIVGFAEAASELFRGGIFDLKFMAGVDNWMGLERLAAAVGTARGRGLAHHAGSDSLLTAEVFVRAVRIIEAANDYKVSFKVYSGLMYGISVPIVQCQQQQQQLQMPFPHGHGQQLQICSG